MRKHYHDDSFLTFLQQRGKAHPEQVLTFGRNIFCSTFSDTDKSNSTWTFKVAISKCMSLSSKNIITFRKSKNIFKKKKGL